MEDNVINAIKSLIEPYRVDQKTAVFVRSQSVAEFVKREIPWAFVASEGSALAGRGFYAIVSVDPSDNESAKDWLGHSRCRLLPGGVFYTLETS